MVSIYVVADRGVTQQDCRSAGSQDVQLSNLLPSIDSSTGRIDSIEKQFAQIIGCLQAFTAMGFKGFGPARSSRNRMDNVAKNVVLDQWHLAKGSSTEMRKVILLRQSVSMTIPLYQISVCDSGQRMGRRVMLFCAICRIQRLRHAFRVPKQSVRFFGYARENVDEVSGGSNKGLVV